MKYGNAFMDAPGFTMLRYFVLNYSNQGAMIWQLKTSKGAYMSSLADEHTQMLEAQQKLSSCLNDALRTFVALEMIEFVN